MSVFKKLLSGFALALGLLAAGGAGAEGLALDHARVKTTDLPSVQRGAKIFANYCLSCHAASYMRYTRLQDLGLTEDEIKNNLIFTTQQIGETMKVAMDPAEGKKWFGTNPPDLTLITRAREGHGGSGADYVYTLFRSFYRDPGTSTGWNNFLFPRIAMPNVLWQLQGERRPIFETHTEEGGKKEQVFTGRWEQVTPGTLTPLQYDQTLGDLVNYLQWMAEPAANKRVAIGVWVLLFLALLTILAWRLNASYWKDVE